MRIRLVQRFLLHSDDEKADTLPFDHTPFEVVKYKRLCDEFFIMINKNEMLDQISMNSY